MDELVPLLYWSAHWLPDVDKGDDEGEPGESNVQLLPFHDTWQELYRELGQILGAHDLFRFVHDPADPNDEAAIVGTLGDGLATIYAELKRQLRLYTEGNPRDKMEAIRQWKFSGGSLWGEYAAELILPIHRLVHDHYDEEDGFDI